MIFNPRRVTASLVLHVLARATSLLVLGMIGILFIGEGVPNNSRLTTPEAQEMATLFGACLELALARRREGAGGLISELSLVAFNLVELRVNGQPAGPAFAVIAIPCLLFLGSS